MASSSALSMLLAAAQSSNEAERRPAEERLKAAEMADFAGYVSALAAELASETTPAGIRQLAGIMLKNSVKTKAKEGTAELQKRWESVDPNIREKVKKTVLSVFGSSSPEARSAAAQICSSLAKLEIPQNQWQDLFEILVTNAKTTNDFLKKASIETVGYICEELLPKNIRDNCDEILQTVVHGCMTEQTNMEVKAAALKALTSALQYADHAFDAEAQRNFLMKIILEATRSSQPEKVRELAFECLVKVAELYYDKLPAYMQAIFNMTISAFQSTTEPESVALQAIEFWTSIADTEKKLRDLAEAATLEGRPVEKASANYIAGALQYLVKALWTTLSRQEEDQDEDAWNVSAAGSTCLSFVAQCTEDNIVPVIMPLIGGAIQSTDWHQKDAATSAFGAVLEGPKSNVLAPYITALLPMVLSNLSDPSDVVKQTSVWVVGKLYQVHPALVKSNVPTALEAILPHLVKSTPLIASKVCWALCQMSEAYPASSESVTRNTCPLSPYFARIVQNLLLCSDRPDADENNLQRQAYTTASTLVCNSGSDTLSTVADLVTNLVQRLQSLLVSTPRSTEEKKKLEETQALVCTVLRECTLRLGNQTVAVADALAALYSRVFTTKSMSVHEEALQAVGALASSLEGNFSKYMEHFLPVIASALKNHEEYEVCRIAIELVSTLCSSLGPQIAPYCPQIITIMSQHIKNPAIARALKPNLFKVIGDMANTLQAAFIPHVNDILALLAAATAESQDDPDDDDTADYLHALREGVCNVYDGIVIAFKAGGRGNDLATGLSQHITTLVRVVLNDVNRPDSLTAVMVNVLTDFADIGPAAKPTLVTPIVQQFLAEVLSCNNTSVATLHMATELQDKIKQLP